MQYFNDVPVGEMRVDRFSELNLAARDIGAAGAMVVSGLLPAMPSLTSLDVRYNGAPPSTSDKWQVVTWRVTSYKLRVTSCKSRDTSDSAMPSSAPPSRFSAPPHQPQVHRHRFLQHSAQNPSQVILIPISGTH